MPGDAPIATLWSPLLEATSLPRSHALPNHVLHEHACARLLVLLVHGGADALAPRRTAGGAVRQAVAGGEALPVEVDAVAAGGEAIGVVVGAHALEKRGRGVSREGGEARGKQAVFREWRVDTCSFVK